MDIDSNREPTRHSPGASTSESAPRPANEVQEKWKCTGNRPHCALYESNLRDVRGLPIFTMQLTYPRFIKEQQCIGWACRVEERKRLDPNRPNYLQSRSYGLWVNSLPESSFEESDPYDIQDMFRTLLFNWDSHETANERKDPRETEIRLGVDSMIEVAFEFRNGGKHNHRAEVDLLLPASPWAMTASNVCMIDLPADWRDFIMSLPNNHIFFADINTLAVVTFASEVEIKDEKAAARRLTYDLCSSQNQRRALGFDDSKIYGATLTGKRLRFYESEWSGDTVCVMPTNRSFDLSSFDEFISCYITLCRLADFESSKVGSTFDKWSSEEGKKMIKERNVGESEKTPWRREVPPSGSHDMESMYTYGLDQFEGDLDFANNDPTKVCSGTAVEEEAPPGGDPLSEHNLRLFERLSRPSALEETIVRTQNFAVGCNGVG